MSFRANIFLALLLLWSNAVFLQETKEDIEKRADKHFENEEFLEATPLYLRLLSLEPRNHNYNYRYGTCLIFNSKEKKSAFKYLRFAVKGDDVDDEAYFYLGKAFHLTYQFKEAIRYYEKYKQKAGNRAIQKLDVNRQIEMCRNGLNLLSTLTEKVVLSKQEISEDDFFRIYDLKDIGGQLIVTEDFQNRQDRRNNHTPVIHIPSKTDKIFYSSYGDRDDNKDIYIRQRLPDGSWSEEQKVQGDVNTPYDEDFPFMHPNGRFLYFASKGHNSMGGYDIFRAIYDEETNSYIKPQNMDFPISSTDDDLLYIVDSLDRKAYFASRREAEFDKLMVYNVRVERFPVQIAVIKGAFESTIDPKNKDLEISVTNARTGEHIGDFETMKNGSYLITLPKGGLYEFSLTVGGKTETFKHEVDVPLLKEFKPLKQQITETIQNDNEVVLISNKFDEEFDDPVAVMAEVIEARSQMEVNKDEFDIDSLDQMREQGKVLAELGLDNFSAVELVQLAEEKVKDLELRLKNSQDELEKAEIQIEKSKQLRRKALRTADSLTTLAENETNPENRKNLLRRAEQARNIAVENTKKIENAEVIKAFMEEDIEKTKPKLQKAKDFNKKIQEVDKTDFEEVVKVISDNEDTAKEILSEQIKVNARFELLDEIREKLKERDELTKKKESLAQQAKSLENEIAELEEDLENARRRKKDDIEMELNSKRNQLEDVNREKDFVSRKIDETDELENQKNTLAEIDNINVEEEKNILDHKDESSDEVDFEEELSKLNERGDKLASEFEDDDDDISLISETEKSEILDEVDDAYIEEIAELKEKYSRGEIDSEEVVKRQEEYQEKLKSEAEKTRSAIESGENVEENKKKLAVLEDEKDKVQSEKESQTDRTTPSESEEVFSESEKEDIISSTSESGKSEIIKSVDENYLEEIADLQEKLKQGESGSRKSTKEEIAQRQEEYLEALNLEAENTLKKIENHENFDENIEKLAILKDEIEKESKINRTEVDEDTEPLEELETFSKEEKNQILSTVKAKEKSDVLGEVDESYPEDMAELLEKYGNNEASSKDIENRQKEYLSLLKSKAEELENKLKAGENVKENKRKLAIIEREYEQESQIDLSSPDIIEELSASDLAELKDEISPGYVEKDKELNEKLKSGSVNIGDVIKNKEDFKEKTESKIDELESKTTLDDKDSRKLLKLKNILNEVENEINQLKQIEEGQLANEISTLSESEKDEILNKTAYKARIEIGELENESDEDSDYELLEAKKSYLNQLSKKKEELKGKSTSTDKELSSNDRIELAVINDEIKKVANEINELEKDILPDIVLFPSLSNRKLVESIGKPSSSAKKLDKPAEGYSALKKQIEILDKLEAKLIQLKEESTSEKEIKEIEKKLKEVQTKKRRAKIAIGDVEQTSDDIAQSTKEKIADSDPEKANEIRKKSEKINELEDEISLLDDVLEDENSSNSEVRRANRKKNRLEKQKTKSEIELLENTAEVSQKKLEEDINDLKIENLDPSTGDLSIQKDLNTIKSLNKQAENTKDEEKKKELLLEANQLQNKTSDKVKEEKNKRKTKVLIDDLSQNLALDNVDSESFSEGKTDLENEQVEIGLKLLDIEDKIKQIDIALETAKRRERDELEELKDNYKKLRSKLEERKEKNDEKLSKIKAQEEEDLSKGVDKEAINAPVSYKEEVEMAQSETYKELFNPVNRLSQKQYELKVKKELVESTKDKIKAITNSMDDPENPTAEEKSLIEKKLKELDEQKSEVNRLRIEIDDIQQEINDKLPTDEREKKIVENLLKREVDPIREIPTLPTMSSGLVIKSGDKKRDTPIPLNPEKPKGLVFRVQVGAFSKPVPDETFDDFSPVTGEEVRPGLIRYVAGYFANRGDATGARNQIRELGYSDAFVVAYCDGERIPVYRAQQLLESGACVPSFDAPAEVIVSSDETDEEMDATSPSFERELDEFSYNKAPGAAEADVAETKMGLYYTVQVGVYNKPVTAEQLNNISPLITKRLPNGQMRYSSGVFDEIDDAREKRQEAIGLGITDAFIVAYYKGERITVSQAKKLVEEHGEEIFELKNPTEVRRNRVTSKAKQVEKPEPEPYLKDKRTHIQWISEESYMTYPSQVLNRYNQTEALFYYDTEDKRIKSFIYNDDNHPKLGEIESELKTIYLYKGLEINDKDAILPNNALHNYANEINYLNVRIAFYDLSHNLMEYLLKLEANKLIKTASGGIEVQIFDSKSEKLDFNTITLQLIHLGVTEITEKSVKLKRNE